MGNANGYTSDIPTRTMAEDGTDGIILVVVRIILFLSFFDHKPTVPIVISLGN